MCWRGKFENDPVELLETMERASGVEPPSSAWKADIIAVIRRPLRSHSTADTSDALFTQLSPRMTAQEPPHTFQRSSDDSI